MKMGMLPSLTFTPPPTKLSMWRWMLAKLPGFCRYCGKHYMDIQRNPDRADFFAPLYAEGRGCPDAHEGYFRELTAAGDINPEKFDNVHPLAACDEAADLNQA